MSPFLPTPLLVHGVVAMSDRQGRAGIRLGRVRAGVARLRVLVLQSVFVLLAGVLAVRSGAVILPGTSPPRLSFAETTHDLGQIHAN